MSKLQGWMDCESNLMLMLLPVADMEEKDRDAHDDKMVEVFCKAVVSHLEGERKDMDVAVFGVEGYNFVGFLVVRCVAMTLEK